MKRCNIENKVALFSQFSGIIKIMLNAAFLKLSMPVWSEFYSCRTKCLFLKTAIMPT